MKRNLCILFTVIVCLSAPALSFALHPDLAIPEKVEVKSRACAEVLRISAKYKIEGIFPKEFEEGKTSCSRLDFAAAIELLTEKLAKMVVNDPNAVVDKADLEILNDLKEELRGEMLLVHTRTFQQRNEDLGTRLHALTKNISLSGGLVGVFQGSLNNKPRNHADVVGRGDIVFSYKVGDHTIAVIDVEATGGNGIQVKSFANLNNVGDSTGDRVRFRQAFVEHNALDDHLVITVGKVDLANYFDANNVANDENSQFLSGSFVNSSVLGAPPKGPGVRVQAKLAESLILSVGYGTGNGDSADIIDHGFGIAELALKAKTGELEGNLRIYGSIDGTSPDADGAVKLHRNEAYGGGLSFDQQLTPQLTLFGRFGWREKHAFRAYAAWSTGFQYQGLIPLRKDDILGFAFGQISILDASSPEKLAELYYKVKINDQIFISPIVQYLINPLGDRTQNNVAVLGLRSQITF